MLCERDLSLSDGTLLHEMVARLYNLLLHRTIIDVLVSMRRSTTSVMHGGAEAYCYKIEGINRGAGGV